MGEVYRAADTNLKRQVAIKVLPIAVAGEAERLARFRREAEVLAAMNHPNIAHIHGLEDAGGTPALVMELVEGPTLAERIAQGAIPVDDALLIARQIAEALEAAHGQGIIHRDLKPANIKVRADGTVKVLDFGLAKAMDPVGTSSSNALNSPTMSIHATEAGLILGTAAYMSPEQAAGKPVDKRSDLWAFGVVLLEMLTGRQVFEGETVSHVLASVLKDNPDWTRLPANTPAPVRRLLRRCLEKDRKHRLADAADARLEIVEALTAPVDASSTGAPRRVLPAVIASAVGAALVTALASWVLTRPAPSAPMPSMRFAIPAPEKTTLGSALSLSPDGRHLAFTARAAGGQNQIWVRSFDTMDARLLTGPTNVTGLFWSPDSRFIAFGGNGKLRKVEASGGLAQTVCDLPGAWRGGAWGPDGTIILGINNRLMRVPAAGGVPAPITADDPQPTFHPSFLPDGRHFLFGRASKNGSDIHVGSLDATPEQQFSRRLLTTSELRAPVFAPSPDPNIGYVLTERENALVGQPFDLRRLETVGAEISIMEGIVSAPGFISTPSYSTSATGVLAFRAVPSEGTASQMLWFDREGKQIGQFGPPGPYGGVELTPDGKLATVETMNARGYDHLWSVDVARGVFSRVNPGDVQDYAGAAISPDGRVAFTYMIDGTAGDIYLRLASGAGTPEPLVKSGTLKHPNHWSKDGRFIVYDDHTAQKQDLWILPMTGNRKPVPFLVTPADETSANFSPDTKWIVYSSDESGRREVYVQGFVTNPVPAAGVGKWKISTTGGDKPRWRRDGKELYYLALDGRLMAVPVRSTATTFEPGVAVPLFQTRSRGYSPYDVAADGRFLINTVDAAVSVPITVVLNWTSGLKK
jgi:eukaryotic-like serine/threonine-protein kinase